MVNYLVTGGAGFIGSHLVEKLLAEGAHVTAIDNFDPFYPRADKLANLAQALKFSTFCLVEADICDMHALRELAAPYDCIVHLAGKAGVRPSIDDPVGYTQVNVAGTLNMLEAAREWHVPQFVYASSSSVYGINPNTPWKESDPLLLPISPYASTKVSGEMMGHVYSYLHGLRFLALRFFTVYGPRQRLELAMHKFARLMLKGKPIPFFGDGSMRRDYTFVADIVAGIRGAMDYRGSLYEVINLGNHHTVSLTEMVSSLEAALGVKAELDRRPPQPGDGPQTWADVSKARELLGYEPRIELGEGLRPLVEWVGRVDALVGG